MRTIFPNENDGATESRTDSAQSSTESEAQKVKFPKIIQHRRFEARIYGKTENYPFYRVAYKAAPPWNDGNDTNKRNDKMITTRS